MPWKELSLEELAQNLDLSISEVREKQRLAQLIIKIRKNQAISQAKLAKLAGVSQGRIAQIESGVGTSKVTFDILLNLLLLLGYDFKIQTMRVRNAESIKSLR